MLTHSAQNRPDVQPVTDMEIKNIKVPHLLLSLEAGWNPRGHIHSLIISESSVL